MIENVVVQTPANGSPSRLSWGSIIAGVVVALTAMIVLNELAISFGLSFVDPLKQGPMDEAAKTAAWSAGAAWTISGLISLFIGGWAAAHLARQDDRVDSVLHGIVVWGLFSIALILLVASALGTIIGGAFRVVGSGVAATGEVIGGVARGAGSAAGGAAQGLGAAAKPLTNRMPSFNWDSIRFELQDLFEAPGQQSGQGQDQGQTQGNGQGRSNGQGAAGEASSAQGAQNQGNQGQGAQNQAAPQATGNDQGAATPDAGRNGANQGSGSTAAFGQGPRALQALVGRVFGSENGSISDADRKTLVSAIASHAHISEADAQRKVAELEQQAAQAKEEFKQAVERFEHDARVAADAAARRLAQAAWLGFAATILGGAAAAFGGLAGNTSARFVRRFVAHPAT